MSLSGKALVIGAGGVTGVAWEVGLLAGLAAGGVDLRTADQIVGSSAGSMVAAQITSPLTLEEYYATQLAPLGPSDPYAAFPRALVARYVWAMIRERNPAKFRQRIGRISLSAKTETEAERRAILAARFPSGGWPQQSLHITAVNAHSGELRVFDKASGVSLLDAVGASCAVPGVWPAVTIDGERWMDGGMRSATNADLAFGRARIVIIAPLVRGFGPLPALATQVRALRDSGAQVAVVSPDEAALTAIGRNPLDPKRREAAARAGHRQAAQALAAVRAVWA